MRYWWVNHKQTFRHEFEGGYIWSPKRKRDGSRNRYYDFLREVVPGNVVMASFITGFGMVHSRRGCGKRNRRTVVITLDHLLIPDPHVQPREAILPAD